jgi:small conductance mechanosensitive channel
MPIMQVLMQIPQPVEELTRRTTGLFEPQPLEAYLTAGLKVLLGILLAHLASKLLRRLLQPVGTQRRFLIAKFSAYAIFFFFFVSALRSLGIMFDAAYALVLVLLVLFAFGARESVSSVISGLVILAQKPFLLHEVVSLGTLNRPDTVAGEVVDIGLLGTTLRTFDGRRVSIDNQRVLEGRVTNYSRSERAAVLVRMDVRPDADVGALWNQLLAETARLPHALADPPPRFTFERLSGARLTWQLWVWCRRDDFLVLRNETGVMLGQVMREHPGDIEGPALPWLETSEREGLSMQTGPPPA